ncbi:MAG: hypothetical protein WAL71_15280 [Terriglobales bacterium]|jgi:hypothetical protein
MRRNISKAWMLVVVAALALPVAAQVRSRAGTTTVNRVSAKKTPYTAEYHGTSVRILADGSTITREETEIVALDSQGRRMNSTTSTTSTGKQAPITHVFVFDPVAHTNTRWSSPGKQATVSTTSETGARGCSTSTSTIESRPFGMTSPARGAHTKPTVENLGTASIQGVEARGTRSTTTIPAGTVGNDAPLVSTTERWTALTVGLNGLIVREIIDDPQMGKWTKELTSIDQSDPDPSVFQPPSNYEIVTEVVTRGTSGGACPAEGTSEAPAEKTSEAAPAK